MEQMTKKNKEAITKMQEYTVKIPRRLNVMYFNGQLNDEQMEHMENIKRYADKLSQALLCLIPSN